MRAWISEMLCRAFGHVWRMHSIHLRACTRCGAEQYLNGKMEWRPLSELPPTPPLWTPRDPPCR